MQNLALELCLEAPGLEISTFIKRIGKEKRGFRHGTQIGKSSSRALEASRLEINTFAKRIDEEKIGSRSGAQIENLALELLRLIYNV